MSYLSPIKSSYPHKFTSPKLDALRDSVEILLRTILEKVEKGQLSEDQVGQLLRLVEKAYVEKKVNIYLESKLDDFFLDFQKKLAGLKLSKQQSGHDYFNFKYYRAKSHEVSVNE